MVSDEVLAHAHQAALVEGRLHERARVVAWLRAQERSKFRCRDLAARIDRGEHQAAAEPSKTGKP